MTREQERKTAAIEKSLGNLLTEAQLRRSLPGSSQNWFNHRERFREEAGVQFRDLWFYLPAAVASAMATIEANRARRQPKPAPVPAGRTAARKPRGKAASARAW